MIFLTGANNDKIIKSACVYPIYTKGSSVKKESLENLRDFPRDFAAVMYSGYSDGIISGFGVSFNNPALTVAMGVLKRKGEIYIIQESTFEFTDFDKDVCVKLCFCDEETDINDDYRTVPVEIKIIGGSDEAAEAEFEIARFNLTGKARILGPGDYKSMDDFVKPYDHLNLVGVKYAGLGGSTFSPELLKEFAAMLLKSGSADALDTAFAFVCLNGSIVHRGCIIQYLKSKGRETKDSADNYGIYQKLREILSNAGSDRPKKKGIYSS